MSTKKSWKDHCEALFNSLPSVGIDSKKLLTALKPLPVEPLTSESYGRLSSTAKQGIATLGVGFSFLYRDLETLRSAGSTSPDYKGLEDEVNFALLPLYRKAEKSFYRWEKNSYPNKIGRGK